MKSNLSIKTAFVIVLTSLLAAFFSGSIILGIGLSNPESNQQHYTFISFIIGQTFMLIPLIWFLQRKKESFVKRLRLNKITKNELVSTVLLSIGIIIISDEFDRIVQIFVPAPEYILDLNGLLNPETFFGFILLFTAVSVVAPLGEELLFRGFFQQILEDHWKDVTHAVLVTALFFSVIHMNPYWFIQIYALGIILGFLAWKTNSVIPALILHSLNNTIALLFSVTSIEDNGFYILNGHVSPLFLIVAFMALFFGFKGINRA